MVLLVKVNGYTTTFTLGDVVTPTNTSDRRLMTVCIVQVGKSQTGIVERYTVDWYDDEYGFQQAVVEPHQIQLYNTMRK